MQYQCMSMEFVPSESGVVQSNTRKAPHYLANLEARGYKVFDRGTGWATISKPAQLLLTLQCIPKGKRVIDVAPYFRENWGRLTAKRGERICSIFPKNLVSTAEEGSINPSLPKQELVDWLTRAQSKK